MFPRRAGNGFWLLGKECRTRVRRTRMRPDRMARSPEFVGVPVLGGTRVRGLVRRAPVAADDGDGEVGGNLDDDDIGRTDDPVRMYLREMGSVELLSREGEIAIAKRIEAGREMMIGGVCENPMTIRAIIAWRDALNEGKMLLRDIIDLDATYGSGVFGPVTSEIPVG